MLLNLPLLSPEAVLASDSRPHAPGNPDVRLVETDAGPHLFVVDGSRVYGLTDDQADDFRAAVAAGGEAVARLLAATGLDGPPAIDDDPPAEMPMRSLSLAVAQKCNLACTYCYAQEGDFGGEAKAMPPEVARAAVRRLLDECPPGSTANLSFLGGEPLLGRAVLREATEFAAELARDRGVRIGFSITSNGTLVRPDDGEFFEKHGFAVTISLDGLGETHDRQRPYKGGSGSFARILENVRPLVARQRRMQVSARVTVTPQNLDLPQTLDGLIAMGFHAVGFSPMLASPTGRGQLQAGDLDALLTGMIACGTAFERRVRAGERYPFTNLVTALREIHRGTHRPYPCGAGAGYFGVSADGRLSACHRFVGDAAGDMGDLAGGVDRGRQQKWLAERHVHRQEPCHSCWARYLCGGGCHHEVLARGRPACDYVRGWLDYCLGAYVRLLTSRPDYFAAANP